MSGKYVCISRDDLVMWRKHWLEENDPKDGTDCVTPFDAYLMQDECANMRLLNYLEKGIAELREEVNELSKITTTPGRKSKHRG